MKKRRIHPFHYVVWFLWTVFLILITVIPGSAYHIFFFRDAADIVTGILPNARLDSSSVTLAGNFLISGQAGFIQFNGSVTSPNTFTSTAGFVGNGSAITGINAGNITQGQFTGSLIADNSLQGRNYANNAILSTHLAGGGGKNYYTCTIGTSNTGLSPNVDFVTTDQTGFNMAIDSCGIASGCTIRVRRGTYTFTGAVQTSANITLEFENGAVIMPAAPTTNLFSASGNITGQLTIIASGAAISWAGSYLLRLNSSATATGVTFRDSHWAASLGGIANENAPIVLTGKSPQLLNAKIINTRQAGSGAQRNFIKVVNAFEPIIANSEFQSFCLGTVADNIIRVMDTYKLKIDSNKFWTFWTGGGTQGDPTCTFNYMIIHRGLTDGPSSGTVISNNVIYSSTWQQLTADQTGIFSQDGIMQGQIVRNFVSTAKGPFMGGAQAVNLASGNVIADNYIQDMGGAQAFRIQNSASNTFIKNNVYTATGAASFIFDAGLNTQIQGNVAGGIKVTDAP